MEHWLQPLVQMKSFLLTVLQGVPLLDRALPPVLKKVSIVMLGGSLGAAGRYGISLLAAKTWGPNSHGAR